MARRRRSVRWENNTFVTPRFLSRPPFNSKVPCRLLGNVACSLLRAAAACWCWHVDQSGSNDWKGSKVRERQRLGQRQRQRQRRRHTQIQAQMLQQQQRNLRLVLMRVHCRLWARRPVKSQPIKNEVQRVLRVSGHSLTGKEEGSNNSGWLALTTLALATLASSSAENPTDLNTKTTTCVSARWWSCAEMARGKQRARAVNGNTYRAHV